MPNRLAIKVSRVKTAEEIQILEDLGVDYIGLHIDDDAVYNIDPDPYWHDDRYLSEDMSADLFAQMKRAQSFAEIADDALTPDILKRLAAQDVHLLQVGLHNPLSPELLNVCKAEQIKLIYDRFYVETGDDLISHEYIRADQPQLGSFDAQLFPSQQDAWATFKYTTRDQPHDGITFEDMCELAAQSPLFISLNAHPANILDIMQGLMPYNFAGLSFTLSPSKIGAFHTFEFDELVGILNVLRADS